MLHEPEIPPNTGNIIRLAANTGVELHLIHPLGFALEDARLRRAGLDYREWARVREHPGFAEFLAVVRPSRWFAFSTRGRHCYSRVRYAPGDALVFGPETRGLPAALLDSLPEERRLCIPMRTGGRSLNLANAVALAVYEAWRQNDFAGAGSR